MAKAPKRRSPVVWLVLAVVLLGLGAWLMRGAEPPERAHAAPVTLPRYQTAEEGSKAEERRTWVPQALPDAGPLTLAESKPRDPVLALMPSEVKRGAMVAEYNAIINSELGPKLAECMFGDGQGQKVLGELRDAGFDPINGIDRVAMIDDAVVMTGDFKGVKWKDLMRANSVKDYGPHGQVYEVTHEDGGVSNFGTWNGQMMIAGDDEAGIKAVLDRLDGSGGQGRPVVDDSMAFGEVYGVVAAEPIADMLREQQPKLADLVLQSAKNVQLHMDVGHDMGLVADVQPSNASTTEDLRRALGGALSMARMKSAAEGDNDAAQLLDLARVGASSGSGGFRIEAGMPHDFMKKALDSCIAERKKREAAEAAQAGSAVP